MHWREPETPCWWLNHKASYLADRRSKTAWVWKTPLRTWFPSELMEIMAHRKGGWRKICQDTSRWDRWQMLSPDGNHKLSWSSWRNDSWSQKSTWISISSWIGWRFVKAIRLNENGSVASNLLGTKTWLWGLLPRQGSLVGARDD